MKFLIGRASANPDQYFKDKPCVGATQESVFVTESQWIKDATSPEGRRWGPVTTERLAWVICINTLEDMMALFEKEGRLILLVEDSIRPIYPAILIYDDFVE